MYRNNGKNIQSPPSVSNLKFETSSVVEIEEFRRGNGGEEDTDNERIERSFRAFGECLTEEFEGVRCTVSESGEIRLEHGVLGRMEKTFPSEIKSLAGGITLWCRGECYVESMSSVSLHARWKKRTWKRIYVYISLTFPLYIHSRSIGIKPISIRNRLFPTEKFYHSPSHKFTIISARESERLLNILASDSRIINFFSRKIFVGYKNLHSFHKSRNIY